MRTLTLKKRLGRALDAALRQSFRISQPFGLHVPECGFPYGEPAETGGFYLGNDYFEAVDAEVYHSLIRHYRPRQVLEIGSGNSTVVALRAAAMNRHEGAETLVTCIEPYPEPGLRRSLQGAGKLIERPVQEVGFEVFEDLSRNDILFIDSSHVAKFGSDVVFEYLEVLPRLKPGVLVHVHDIFIPFDYPRKWIVDEHKFWNEQYLLQAFLCSTRPSTSSGRAAT